MFCERGLPARPSAVRPGPTTRASFRVDAVTAAVKREVSNEEPPMLFKFQPGVVEPVPVVIVLPLPKRNDDTGCGELAKRVEEGRPDIERADEFRPRRGVYDTPRPMPSSVYDPSITNTLKFGDALSLPYLIAYRSANRIEEALKAAASRIEEARVTRHHAFRRTSLPTRREDCADVDGRYFVQPIDVEIGGRNPHILELYGSMYCSEMSLPSRRYVHSA